MGTHALRMRWLDLLFLHWRLEPEALEARLPEGLVLDTFDGSAWIGLVPFDMRIAPRALPYLPWLGAFPEINVRTYVRREDAHGVWFFSLDVSHALPVWVARTLFHLPYFKAKVGCQRLADGTIDYRLDHPERQAHVRYRPSGIHIPAPVGSLEHFLTERYFLYSADARGRLFRGRIAHQAWPLEAVEVALDANTATPPFGAEGPPASALFSRALDVKAWPLQPLSKT
ncbi:MAG: YqjF family protein [Opitutales bacterium]